MSFIVVGAVFVGEVGVVGGLVTVITCVGRGVLFEVCGVGCAAFRSRSVDTIDAFGVVVRRSD